jgi:Zn-dependent peptidase ImmA (M78 family)/transcriptional regulator with XRE-family HTH domain
VVSVHQGERIRQARERVGLNQRELARLAGVSQPTISRVERGDHPGLAVTELHRIATATGTTVAALLRGDDCRPRLLSAARLAVRGEAPARGGSARGGAPVRGEDVPGPVGAAEATAADLLELDALLDALSVPGRQVRKPLLVDVDPGADPPEQGRAAAVAIRAAHGLGSGPIADVDELVEQVTGVDVVRRELDGVSGFTAVDPDRDVAVVLVGATEPAERQRFTAAHELAHLAFPGDPGHRIVADGPKPPREIRADVFARHLLMPLDGVRAWLTGNAVDEDGQDATVTEAELAALAAVFGVSPLVALIQLEDLGRAPVDVDRQSLPTGRALAYRHGRGAAHDVMQRSAHAGRPAVRLVDRATRAYRDGRLGLPPLARLLGMDLVDARLALADAGVVPTVPDRATVVDSVLAGHRMAGLEPTADDRRTAERIVAGEATAAQAVERLTERHGG